MTVSTCEAVQIWTSIEKQEARPVRKKCNWFIFKFLEFASATVGDWLSSSHSCCMDEGDGGIGGAFLWADVESHRSQQPATKGDSG